MSRSSRRRLETTSALPFLLGSRHEAPQERDGAVTTLKVAELEVLFFARVEVGKRVEMRRAGSILLGEPHLIAPQRGLVENAAEQVGVVRREDELGALGILFRVVEQTHDF